MQHRILTSENLTPALWSGGKTTQLFIYPETAEYQKRNFKFRLSTSTVETEKSEFTLLPGLSRKLMVLEGNVTLFHEGHYSKELSRFDTDEFDGGWRTTSIGKCTDFNLMTSGNTTGKLSPVLIEKEQSAILCIEENRDWLFIYVYSGKTGIELNKKIIVITKGDLLILNNLTAGNIEIKGIENSELVLAEINLL
jgi:environmental stress-induced protein Ves